MVPPFKTVFVAEKECDEYTEPFTTDNLNALRYTAGYVPYKLLQKYMRAGCLHPSRQSFILCLSSMAQSEREDTEYTFLEYTEKWVCAVDHGGLFHVSDEVL